MICEELFGSISNYCLLVHTYSLFDVLLYKTSHSGVHSYGTLFSFQRSSPFVTACLSYQTQKSLSRTFFEEVLKNFFGAVRSLSQQLVYCIKAS